jgi:hypothetical protein
MTDVAANGKAVYYLKEGSHTAASPLLVEENNDQIVVTTGPLRVRLNKKNFDLFRQVDFDRNLDGAFSLEERIIASDTGNGGIMTLQNGEQQQSSNAQLFDPPMEVELEERGPIRAVIRFETCTNARADQVPVHGFQARLYFYAGSDLVRVQYTIKNSDHRTGTPQPLYFKDVSLISKLAFIPTRVKFETNNGVYESDPGKGSYLYQSSHDHFTINDGAGNVLSAGSRGSGWIDVSDSSHGVTAIVQDFWQTWPGAVEFNQQNQLRIGLWPRFGRDWWWDEYGSGKTFASTPLYWLDDMQEPTKEVWYTFHNGLRQAARTSAIAAAVQMPPVGVIPLSWYKETKTTLDLGGYIPLDAPLTATGTFNDYLLMWQAGRSEAWSDGGYTYGWFNYAGNMNRRYPCSGGGWPYSAARFLMTENPAFYYEMRAKALGELNGRPMWLSAYRHDRDQSAADLFFGYCWASWRRNENASYLAGTDFHQWRPRDLAHLWIYDLEEHYYFSGEKRIRDWYRFMGEAMKVPLIDQYPWETQTRSTAHALAALLQAYRITGQPEFLATAKQAVANLRQYQVPYNGTLLVKDVTNKEQQEATFQIGFLARALINYLLEIGDADPQAEVDAWGVLQGFMEWNLNLAQFCYYWPGNAGTTNGSSGMMMDPQAWYYLHTGIKEYATQLIWFFDHGAYGNPRRWGWEGNAVDGPEGPFVHRLTHYMLKYPKQDTTPPEKITDLSAQEAENGVRLRWTAPLEARKYHIRWSRQPIASTFTTDRTFSNFWAAQGVGKNLLAQPGTRQELVVTDLPVHTELYFAVISFDSTHNMSELSNVVRVLYNGGTTGERSGKAQPRSFDLQQNSPNPFAHHTYLAYAIPESGAAELRIYNIAGQLVKRLYRYYVQPGNDGVFWDGRDDNGQSVSNGVYCYSLTVNGKWHGNKKMLVLQ